MERKTVKRRRVKRKAGGFKKAVTKIAKKAVLSMECRKRFLTSLTGTASLTGAPALLFNIARGTGSISLVTAQANRLKNKIRIALLRFRVNCYMGSTDQISRIMRIVVFKVKATEGNVPISSELYADNTTAVTSCFNINYVPKTYSIVFDKTVALRSIGGGSAAISNTVAHFRKSKHYKSGIVQQYNDGVLGTAADMEANVYFISVTTDNATAGTPFCNIGVQVDFYDS